MTLAELARELEIGHATLYEWQQRGLPGRKRGARWFFDLEKVRAWVEKNRPLHGRPPAAIAEAAGNRADADTRKAVALAELRELELAKRRGEVYDRAEIASACSAMTHTLAARLLELPAAVAQGLEGKPAEEIERVLAGEVRALMAVVRAAPFAAWPILCEACAAAAGEPHAPRAA